MRLRTLPVSVAGVTAGCALAIKHSCFNPLIGGICLSFAILSQIASNFANEYFDFKDGLDAPGREGPRRGVTEGDISPRAMLIATLLTLIMASVLGCSLIYWGGWWMLPAGIAIALGVLAYSTGPYPLSRHGLGEVAVILFFGIAPVSLTYYLQSGHVPAEVFSFSVTIGLMGTNVLIINNYRDFSADSAVHKQTLAVLMGSKRYRYLYIINAAAAVVLALPAWKGLTVWISLDIQSLYFVFAFSIFGAMRKRRGHRLTPLLGATSMLMFIYSIVFLIAATAI